MTIDKRIHTDKEIQTIWDYEKAIDYDIYNFILDVISDRDVLPVTVGFVNKTMAEKMRELTGLDVEGNRIVLGADDVRHIIKRHGEHGKADHSMKDFRDIARMSYVLANYDSIEWDGGVSDLYRTKSGNKAPQVIFMKRVDGTYYIIQVVSDSKHRRNVVTTVYLKKADK